MKGKYYQYKCVSCYSVKVQKQPSIGFLRKRSSEKSQQIYRRSLVQDCDFKKVA